VAGKLQGDQKRGKALEYGTDAANSGSSLRIWPATRNEAEAAMLTLADRVVVPQHVLVRFMDRESVLLNLETERYFGLDETGTRMWQVVTSAPSVETALQQLMEEYDAEPEVLQSNLTELLGRLMENGLLSLNPADVGTPSTV